MKKLLITIVIIGLAFWACTDESSVIGPKESKLKSDNIEKQNWIQLPAFDNSSLSKSFFQGDFIKLNKGGHLHIKEDYDGGPFGKVKLDVKIEFDKDFVREEGFYNDVDYVFDQSGDGLYITLLFDDESCSATFTPHIEFDKPAILDMKIEGIDFSFLDLDNIRFAYLPEGSEEFEYPVYKSLKIDPDKGKLEIKGAEIPHFSRFGFTN